MNGCENMIPLECYSEEFESAYLNAVERLINKTERDKVIESCRKFLPDDFFSGEKDTWFRTLILAPFEKLKNAETFITNDSDSNRVMKTECFNKKKRQRIRKLYMKVCDSYSSLAKSVENGTSMRVRIVRSSGLTVCPYCNRDYINSRAEKVSGAQLDHFFSKSDYPLFAVCLYNLVPVCGNCNRIKNAKKILFTSPFDDSVNWEKDIVFSYKGNTLKNLNIIINTNGSLENNIKEMRIDKAYEIHAVEVLELIEKEKIYNSSQRDEFKEVLGQTLTDFEIKKIIFGPEIKKECMRTKPLGKMLSDLHKELKIYS